MNAPVVPRRATRDYRGIVQAATGDIGGLLLYLDAGVEGLSSVEAANRLARIGSNAVASHKVRVLAVLWRQVRSPLLGLLIGAATASFFVGERGSAVIIGTIVCLSVGLGFVNELKAERAAESLHSQIKHVSLVLRDGKEAAIDVLSLVPGDVLDLRLGDVVPADLRLLSVAGLECDEAILTGESLPVAKAVEAVPVGTALGDLTCAALMGTVVHAGSGRGLVVSTGPRTELGAIAAGLDTAPMETEFQAGLRRFSLLLVYVAGTLTTAIFVLNVILQRPVLEALLFSLAIAVGITPQLLPAVVSSSLATGSGRMRRKRVLVKRLVCIEDLGDIDVLFTDKTGTLTEGKIDFSHAIPSSSNDVVLWGLLCTEHAGGNGGAVGANPLDAALWARPASAEFEHLLSSYERLAVLPFDHDRRRVSVVVKDDRELLTLVTKGAPEGLLELCRDVPEAARTALAKEFAAGNRVVAVASRPVTSDTVSTADEHDLRLIGLLVFLDPPKAGAAEALRRLAGLGIAVKVVTGDNAAVAVKVCSELGLAGNAALTGAQIDALADDELGHALPLTTVFARVTPEHKARIVRLQRRSGGGVAFLGDGVNDALAMHAADVGISVDSATDVAKDAADVILLDKDLNVLADGVAEGRRIFANTIKYVLMGTSSNFGNMFSAAGASLFLSFLPMLPSQILLNNMLYDASQLAIPTDNVDDEQLRAPSHWDIAFIRRFMLFFGPLSSVFDFATFAVMLWVFHSGPPQFRSGWFIESLATQTLIIFAIRTRRVPFFRSRPSVALSISAVGAVLIGAVLPSTPIAHALGFHPLPLGFFVALVAMVVCYLALIEAGKRWFYGVQPAHTTRRPRSPQRHLRRRITRFSTEKALTRTAAHTRRA